MPLGTVPAAVARRDTGWRISWQSSAIFFVPTSTPDPEGKEEEMVSSVPEHQNEPSDSLPSGPTGGPACSLGSAVPESYSFEFESIAGPDAAEAAQLHPGGTFQLSQPVLTMTNILGADSISIAFFGDYIYAGRSSRTARMVLYAANGLKDVTIGEKDGNIELVISPVVGKKLPEDDRGTPRCPAIPENQSRLVPPEMIWGRTRRSKRTDLSGLGFY
ncbi:hypothetical protein BZA05DRAFT_439737 [Tricharina praecox]|uniref:uncharacterized protein n=1 Tax=Tricharina praecox TaxID=43433 RepID=UPI002220937B|nr:uncharacterized protein BZA05DRAFT_439737 [Tricharina praecox]KAI5841611.1 hypothetical protein BZA05DRAFT_439737 [Tricharina praecox]